MEFADSKKTPEHVEGFWPCSLVLVLKSGVDQSEVRGSTRGQEES